VPVRIPAPYKLHTARADVKREEKNAWWPTFELCGGGTPSARVNCYGSFYLFYAKVFTDFPSKVIIYFIMPWNGRIVCSGWDSTTMNGGYLL
jgi:hypothetical protein